MRPYTDPGRRRPAGGNNPGLGQPVDVAHAVAVTWTTDGGSVDASCGAAPEPVAVTIDRVSTSKLRERSRIRRGRNGKPLPHGGRDESSASLLGTAAAGSSGA